MREVLGELTEVLVRLTTLVHEQRSTTAGFLTSGRGGRPVSPNDDEGADRP